MLEILCAIIMLGAALQIETQGGPRLITVRTAELGDTVTLHCAASQEDRAQLFWYKQSLGYVPQTVATAIYEKIKVNPPFNLRFNVELVSDFIMTILNVTKGDEANYLCQQGFQNSWNNGTFLSVEDHKDHRFVIQTVVQQPESASVQLGDPVALQCSVTSQRTDHSNQCQGEPTVYWFRSGSGPPHPAAIYMNGNRSGECQDSSGSLSAPQSCVYTLPMNNVVTSDAGTYYCALAACGEVVFGHGTKLNITEPSMLLVTMTLGILLACCLVVIIILLLTRNQKQICEQCKGMNTSYVAHDSVVMEQQDGETHSLNYAALEFSGRKMKGGKNRDMTTEILYSPVGINSH